MKDFKHTHKMHHGHHPVFGGGARPAMQSAGMSPMMPPGGMGGIQSAGEDMASSAPGGMSGGAPSGMGAGGAGAAGGTGGAGYKEGGMAKGGNWIKNATKNKGALHRSLGVPMGEKIPMSKIKKAEKSSDPKLAKRARLAETLKGFKK